MRIGADTWFLVLLSEGNENAKKLFKQIAEGQHELFISALSISEIMVVLLRKGVPELAEKMLFELVAFPNVHIVSFGVSIATESAKIKHSLGLSLVDAGIITTALANNCTAFVADDGDYRHAKKLINIAKPEDLL